MKTARWISLPCWTHSDKFCKPDSSNSRHSLKRSCAWQKSNVCWEKNYEKYQRANYGCSGFAGRRRSRILAGHTNITGTGTSTSFSNSCHNCQGGAKDSVLPQFDRSEEHTSELQSPC